MKSNKHSGAAASKSKYQKSVQVLLTAAALAAVPWTMQAAGPAPVNLGSTARFTILAGAAITTTGGGVINGDVGASPIAGSGIHLLQAQVHGTIYTVDATGPAGSVIDPALLTRAKGDLTTAFNDAAGRTPIPSGPQLNPGAGNIGGMTLIPGLYKFTGTAMITGSNLTLSGGPDDVWIFQIASDLQVGNSIQIILAGGAQPRNIFWQVGTSAVIGTAAVFNGTIIADQSITMNSTSTMNGRALAFSGGVTYNGLGGQLPTPAAPEFAAISRPTPTSVTLVVDTTPFYKITLQSRPVVGNGAWTTVTTATPGATPWTHTHTPSPATPELFYKAFLTVPN
jgi:hypothetical protein